MGEFIDYPDAKAHLLISMLKSAVRILTCIGAAFSGSIVVLAVGIGAAEVIGVLEELV